MKYNKIGVIGAGTMGIDLCVDLILHNKEVILIDVSEHILDKAKSEITKILKFAKLLNINLPYVGAEQIRKQLNTYVDLNRIADCEFIIENVNEDILIKKELYSKLSKIIVSDVSIGSNTSCISITELGSFSNHTSNIVGIHLMNPVYKKEVVEVIRGAHTSDKCIEDTKCFLNTLDKNAIIVQDYPGFVSNRISHLFMNEAAFVVQDQLATPEQVDTIFTQGFGHAMGPLKTADLIGLDIVVASLKVLYESYQDSKFRCCPLLQKMVYAGYLGVKTKQGFYKY